MGFLQQFLDKKKYVFSVITIRIRIHWLLPMDCIVFLQTGESRQRSFTAV